MRLHRELFSCFSDVSPGEKKILVLSNVSPKDFRKDLDVSHLPKSQSPQLKDKDLIMNSNNSHQIHLISNHLNHKSYTLFPADKNVF